MASLLKVDGFRALVSLLFQCPHSCYKCHGLPQPYLKQEGNVSCREGCLWEGTAVLFSAGRNIIPGRCPNDISLCGQNGNICLVPNLPLAKGSRSNTVGLDDLDHLSFMLWEWESGTLSPTNWVSINWGRKGKRTLTENRWYLPQLPISAQQMAIRILSWFLSPLLYLTIRVTFLSQVNFSLTN